MTEVKNKVLDEERALYGSNGIIVDSCRFDGPADGESALKESRDVTVKNSYFNLRYPFWHIDGLKISGCELTKNCRAALWYSKHIAVSDSKLHGIKAFRECEDIIVDDCDIDSEEFGWSLNGITIRNSTTNSQYLLMNSARITFESSTVNGKYSFQYIRDSVIEDCTINTKDALWHARNVVVKNCTINSEYLAWYSENVTFENCTLIGTQPLCYCKKLKLKDCKMVDADFAFEKSDVDATVTTPVLSIRNPLSGTIRLPQVDELIMDDENAKGEVIVSGS